MKCLKFCVFFVLFCGLGHAGEKAPDRTDFFEAVVIKASYDTASSFKAFCVAKVPEYAQSVDDAFAAWSAAYKPQIDKSAALVAKIKGGDFTEIVKRNDKARADMLALFSSSSQEVKETICRGLPAKFWEPGMDLNLARRIGQAMERDEQQKKAQNAAQK